jgi:predicted DNA-binding transcriptional regulator AlpA
VSCLRTITEESARFITRAALCRRWGISRSTSYRLQRNGYLRPPVRFGPGVVRWSMSDIEAIEASASEDCRGRTR